VFSTQDRGCSAFVTALRHSVHMTE